ncbi:MAG: hypothetical protein GX574_16945 [Lentisphaerae bacterium]|nr:hypothetical protein [Lentisphaerota bacterium]OQC14200.1 MAG: hypothetical protein BWX73_01895 [Lentisphaerae bacterium ADurb.Bin082]HQL86828.1 hypothetical protein [Lentisphaeria bacterium]
MMNVMRQLCCVCALSAPLVFAGDNLLQNPSFEFHSFINHREGKAVSHTGNTVAFWRHGDYGDVTVTRESQASTAKRPPYSVHNLVSIRPGKKLWQFIPLPSVGLAHGDVVELAVGGWQSAAGALQVSVVLLKLDSEDGTWKPSDFGYADTREFPRHGRGEFVAAHRHDQTAAEVGAVELRLRDIVVEGHFHQDNVSRSEDMNTIALQVEIANVSADAEVLAWAPCLARAGQGPERITGVVPSLRPMNPVFRHLPRTIQKLWKGEAIHIVLMGSSIDRGSANPPMYLYDEDPQSSTFKQPLSERVFEAEKVGRPDLAGYYGWWQHYFSYAGRLRLELMRRFNLPVEKICLNFMACDGSCIGEATSGLAEYCSLSIPPAPGDNGYQQGGDWKTLHPELFSRPGGHGPDLVIYGSGANEKTDTPDEIAPLEASIRWIQRHYPQTEFLFCMFQNRGGYTPNPGDLQALALRYQIPFMDYGKLGDDVTRWCNRYALVPSDGHPQAAAHDLWFHVLSQAFECWDPTPSGVVQLRLPERIHPNTIGWEGEIRTYQGDSPRLKGNMAVLEDTALNCWASCTGKTLQAFVNGETAVGSVRTGASSRNIRNSTFRWGRGRLGDRQILELVGEDAKLTAIDLKVVNGRRFYPSSHPALKHAGLAKEEWSSAWGAPYGEDVLVVPVGQTVELTAAATDFSIAYLDHAEGGTLIVLVDGQEQLRFATNVAFVDQAGNQHFMENRQGIRDLPFGLHTVRLAAEGNPVRLLGIYTYDTRANLQQERRIAGLAAAGETIVFEPPFQARPVILCSDGLQAPPANIRPESVTFTGQAGSFLAIGE